MAVESRAAPRARKHALIAVGLQCVPLLGATSCASMGANNQQPGWVSFLWLSSLFWGFGYLYLRRFSRFHPAFLMGPVFALASCTASVWGVNYDFEHPGRRSEADLQSANRASYQEALIIAGAVLLLAVDAARQTAAVNAAERARSGGVVPRTLGGYLEAAAERFGERPALLYRPRYRLETWSYARLWQECERVAAWLQERGVEKGDRVVLWAPNSPWWVAAYFGCLRIGAIVVPLDVRSGPDYVRRVVDQTEPKLALLSRATTVGWVFATPWSLLEDLDRTMGGEVRGGDVAGGSVEPGDVAEVVFTSGTTGDPKGVILTHGNVTANVQSAMQVIPNAPDHRLLSLLPLSHMFEQTVGLLLPLGCGASIVYPTSRQSTAVFRDLASQGITTVLAVPQALELLIAAIEREVRKEGKERRWRAAHRLAENLPTTARRLLFRRVHRRLGGRLRLLVSGGAPLDPELARAWDLLGVPVLQGYGATEASPIITGTTLEDPRPGSVGKAVPGVEVALAADGEVLVRGPNVTPGYWRNDRATEEAFRDGWYRTGDLGVMTGDGYLYLRGRKKDLIVLANGQNVYPSDVERALREAGAGEAAVVGLPGARGAEVHAVFLDGPGQPDPAALVRRANERLAAHQQIRGWTIWPEPDFPRTHTLKVKKSEVLRRLEAAGGATTRATPATSIGADARVSGVAHIVAEAAGTPPSALRPEMTLGDCGLDSLRRVEMLATIESELGVYLDESRVDERTTLAELEAMAGAQQAATRPAFSRWPLSTAARAIRSGIQAPLLPLLNLVAPTTVRGREELEGIEPPAIFVANHASHLDSPVLLKSLPRRWRRTLAVAAAADYFFERPALGAAVALGLNAFPFSREGNVRATLEHCAWLLDNGWSILLYPEGTRSTTRVIGPFKAGVGLLAVELGVPVVPVRIDGLWKVLPKGCILPRRGAVRVRIGRPLRFDASVSYADAAAAMEAAVRGLLAP